MRFRWKRPASVRRGAPGAGKATRESVLFVTLDSCRYDTMAAADAPAIRSIGPLRAAQAPGYFTFASHAAMFVGFTPVASTGRVPLLNPKFARIFKLVGAGYAGKGGEGFELEGADIVRGFARRGYTTVGTSAIGWFDPGTAAGRHLSSPFRYFRFIGGHGRAEQQIAWVTEQLNRAPGDVFAFLNLGETHVPYWHRGATWSARDNPCVPFQTIDRAADCRLRQGACVRHLDRLLAPLIERFAGATILLCADHGDAWGEDGLWEHGIPHPAVLTVPMLLRLRGQPV